MKLSGVIVIRTLRIIFLALSSIGAAVVCPAQTYPPSISVDYKQVPQIASQLCWAATMEMVINSFYDDDMPLVDQYQLAQRAYDYLNLGSQIGATCDCTMSGSGWSVGCCDNAFYPQFDWYGFSADFVPVSASDFGSAALPVPTWQAVQKELYERKHPFIFGWDYGQSEGEHIMIAGGYETDANGKRWVNIYDPLPMPSGNPYRISYDNYAVNTATMGLNNDMGLPIEHWGDYLNVRRAGATPGSPIDVQVSKRQSSGNPSPTLVGMKFSETDRAMPGNRAIQKSQRVAMAAAGDTATIPPATGQPTTSPRPAAAAQGVRALQAIQQSRRVAARALAAADLPNARAASRPAGVTAGFPFPIVALSLSELRNATESDVGRLLQKRINVTLFPVESSGQVIDNFLMIRSGGTWKQGGYANLMVTKSLVSLREAASPTDSERSKYYLLSVPALGGFFLGHGSGSDTRLIPATDFSPQIRAGVPYTPEQLFPVLMNAAKRYAPPAAPTGLAVPAGRPVG